MAQTIMRMFFVVFLMPLFLFGCATFRIPAPHAPVKPFQQPVVEKSSITVPIAVSVSALTNKLDQLFAKNKGLQKLNEQNNITGKVQDLLNGQADSELLNNMYVRLAIGKAWDALQNPIRLNYNLSLLLNPEAIRISPASRKGDTATFHVGVVANPKLVSGDLPKTTPQSPPNVSLAKEAPEKGFHLVLDNELSFDFISAELTKKFEGKTYAVHGKTITIGKIKMYGSNDSVILAAKVKGTVSGIIYLIGVPAYDEPSMTVFINNLDYTLETKNVLAKAADWLLHSELRDKLAEQTKWPLSEKVEAVQNNLADALNRKVNRHVKMKGSIQQVRPLAIGITNTSLKAVLVADGVVEVSVF